MKYKLQIFNEDALKIIAMAFMLIDHIASYLLVNSPCYIYLRIIGRLSFPLFAFMLVEGVRYSRKPLKYLFTLLIFGIVMDIFTYIFLKIYIGSVLITLFIGGLCIYFLEKQKGFYKLFAIIPFAIGILSGFEFFPLRILYGPYGLFTIILFYLGLVLARYLSNYICSFGLDKEEYLKSNNFTTLYVLIGSILNLTFNMLGKLFIVEYNALFTANTADLYYQTYSTIAYLLLFLYTGKRGINNKYFKYGCYLFFPLHYVLIFLIGLLINL